MNEQNQQKFTSRRTFKAYNGLLVSYFRRSEKFAFFRRFGNQIFDAMDGHHSETAENKMQNQVKSLRIFDT